MRIARNDLIKDDCALLNVSIRVYLIDVNANVIRTIKKYLFIITITNDLYYTDLVV